MSITHGSAVTGSTASLRSTTSYTAAVYNLNSRYEKKMDERFKTKSYTESGANLSGFNWANTNAITIETTGVGRVNAYDFDAALGSRMGTMHEISDQMNTYQLKHYYAIRETYEKLYSDDKLNERKIQRILKDINDEVLVPMIDKYRLKTWADGCGYSTVLASALGKSNIVEELLKVNTKMDNMRIPEEGRMCYMGLTDVITMQLADELKYQQEFTNKGAINGAIRKLGRTTVIGIPDSLMPSGCKAIFKWKKASVDPRKLTWSQVYPHVEGYSGPVVNGLYRFDSFVLAQKANGIVVLGDTSSAPQAMPTAAASTASGANKITFTSASSTAVYYTYDGHNPKIVDNGTSVRLSTTTGTAVAAPTADCYIQAYAVCTTTGSEKVASGIAKWKYNVTANTVTALSYDEEVPI